MDPSQIIDELHRRYTASHEDSSNHHENLTSSEIEAWSRNAALDSASLLDNLAVEIASRFHQHRLAYQPSDWIINHLFEAIASSPHMDFPKLFLIVYDAFEAGEYYHDGNRDEEPDEVYTRPAVAAILRQLEQP